VSSQAHVRFVARQPRGGTLVASSLSAAACTALASWQHRKMSFDLLFNSYASPSATTEEHRRWINALWSRLQREARQAAGTSNVISQLHEENAELKLYVAVLARMLITKGICSVQELSALLDSVDREDGRPDGKLTGRPLPGQKPRLPKPPRKLNPKPAKRRP
jgi:hypothetical protein